MQSRLQFQIIIAAIILSLAVACKHSPDDMANPDIPGNPPPVDTIVCDSTNVT